MCAMRIVEPLSVLVALAWPCVAAPALAQEADVSQLIKELSGHGPAVARTEAQLQEAYQRVIEATLPGAKNPDEILEPIVVRAGAPGAEPHRRALVQAMLAWLLKTDSPNQRVFLLNQLGLLGQEESVPVLAGLLKQEPAWLRQYALAALERNPSAAAGKALADALRDAKESRWCQSVIHALGRRREPVAVETLHALARSTDLPIAEAAAMALGNIATAEAAAALCELAPAAPAGLQPAIVRALLLCADRLCVERKPQDAARLYRLVRTQAKEPFLRMAALRGLARSDPQEALPLVMETLQKGDAESQAQAIRLLVEMPEYGSSEAALALAAKLPASVRPLMAEALFDAARRGPGEAALRDAALEALGSGNTHLARAAVGALGQVGSAADAPRLAALATAGEWSLRETALDSLVALGAPGTDAAILDLLEKADAKTRLTLFRVVVARRMASAIPTLIQIAQDAGADSAVRLEARKALQALPDAQAADALVALLLAPQTPEEREIVERAIAASCQKIGDPLKRAEPLLRALRGADVAGRCTLLPALGRVGGPEAAEVVRAALQDPSPALQDAGVRALCNWPDAVVADQLLDLARTGREERHRVWALRAFARVVSLPGQRAPQEAAASLRQALRLADKPENKKFILSRLAAVRVAESLALAMSCLEDPQVHDDAASMALQLAQALRFSHPAEARAALQTLSQTAKQEAIRQQAAATLARMAP